MERKAKIICTIGPGSEKETILRKMIMSGMDIARLNFSHGTHKNHLRNIRLIRKISRDLQKPVTILQDLQGPKLRVSSLPDEGIHLKSGMKVLLVPEVDQEPQHRLSDPVTIPVMIPNLNEVLKTGDRILINDGIIELRVIEIKTKSVQALVISGGQVTSHKGINLPDVDLKIPGFTEKDFIDLEFGLSHGVDSVAISFVSSANDINLVKDAIKIIAPNRIPPPLIAKLERPQAMRNLHEILNAADGVMVARGDLAVETSPADVPIFQKKIIEGAFKKAKYVITATQMLESMIKNPRPTRAEASDVANAILDGTDAVMLSGETAIGDYPVEAVKMMDSIVKKAEANMKVWGSIHSGKLFQTKDDAIAITRVAGDLACNRDVKFIAVLTQSGRTARLMSKVKPNVPILAFTPIEDTYRTLSLYWGTKPYLIPYSSTLEEMLNHVENSIIQTEPIENGQQIIFVSGLPIKDMVPPNLLLLHTITKK